MIVKHIPIRKLSKSSFSGLVNYITNAQDRNERVGEVSDGSSLPFAGLRQIEGKALMLLQTPSQILVLPIENKAIRYAQNLKIGSSVNINSLGIARTRGRRI